MVGPYVCMGLGDSHSVADKEMQEHVWQCFAHGGVHAIYDGSSELLS
jgi:hypothetical protein